MIELRNVNYIYQKGMPSQRQALFDISLKIPDGVLAALIGHTGSGKSTLIQLLNALEKPSSGSIIINGTDITEQKADLKALRREVGLVFQYPEYQLFEETVYKDIAFGPTNMGLGRDEIDRRVRSAAETVGLDKRYLQRSPFELSGGQKRRCAIAGVLAMEPRILVLDEPAAGLDPMGRNDILRLLKRLHKDRPEMTILFVSHSMEDVAQTAEYVYVMSSGRLAMEGTPEEIFSRSDELERMSLSPPKITELFLKLRQSGYNVPDNVYTVSRAADVLEDLLKGGGRDA